MVELYQPPVVWARFFFKRKCDRWYLWVQQCNRFQCVINGDLLMCQYLPSSVKRGLLWPCESKRKKKNRSSLHICRYRNDDELDLQSYCYSSSSHHQLSLFTACWMCCFVFYEPRVVTHKEFLAVAFPVSIRGFWAACPNLGFRALVYVCGKNA